MRDGTIEGTRYRESGDGPPIVLIHGVGADLEMWQPVAERLEARHRVIRYDMIGHGGSAKRPSADPRGPLRLGDFVDQLSRLADALALAPFRLVGFSMGGLVAQGFALARPAAVARLVLLHTVFDRDPAERAAIAERVRQVLGGGYAASIDAAIERWFTPAFRAAAPETIAAVRRRMAANDLGAYAAAYAVFATADRELAGRIGAIEAPTLVATGSDDQRSTPAMARALAVRLPNAVCRIIDGQRHMSPLETPAAIAALIAAFVETGEIAGGAGSDGEVCSGTRG